MDLITVSIHTKCNTQPFEAPTIIIFTEFSIGLTSLYRHIMRERERERDSHLQRMFMCYTAQKLKLWENATRQRHILKNLV